MMLKAGEQSLRDDWAAQNIEVPHIVYRAVTTSQLKRSLLALVGSSGAGFWKLVDLDRRWAEGVKEYTGPLNLDSQIAFLELAMGHKSGVQVNFEQEIENNIFKDILDIERKLNELVAEREFLKLAICEAEEML